MKGTQVIMEFDKGEATPELVANLLSNVPNGSTMKVLSYMNGDLRKITVTTRVDE